MIMHKNSLSAPRLLNGLKLLAILPPLGIAWLIYLSRGQWLQLIKRPKSFGRDPFLAFILLLMGVTGLNLNHHDYRSVWLSLLMLFVLLNLWLLCRQTTQMISLHALRRFIIQFGLYITISGNLFHWLNQWLTLPNWFKFLLGDLLWGYAANQNRLFGSAYNPNDACCLLLIALGLLLAQLTSQSATPIAPRTHLRNAVLVFVLSLGVYQTKSRTGLAILAILLIVTAFQLFRRHRLWLTGLLISGSALGWAFFPRSHSFSASLQTRLTIWHNSFDLFKQAPLLGVTYFGFARRYFRLTGTYVPHAHDILLMLLASFGILGGVGFLALVVNSGWHLTKSWHEHQQPNLRYFIMTLPIILAYGLTDFVLSSLQVLIIIFLLVAYWHREQQVSRQLALDPAKY